MGYLTLVEYTAYGGTLIDPAFSRLEYQARSLVDTYTFGRLQADTTYPEPVKRLMFELIGLIGNNDTTAAGYSPAVQSEGNDGYSISMASGSIPTLEQVEATKGELIAQYLTGVRNQAGESLLLRWA